MSIDAVSLARWETWLAADPSHRQMVEEAAGDPSRASDIAIAAGIHQDAVVTLLRSGGAEEVVRPAADRAFELGLSPSKEVGQPGARLPRWQALADREQRLEELRHILRIQAGDEEMGFQYIQMEGMGLLPDVTGHTVGSVTADLERVRRQREALESSAQQRRAQSCGATSTPDRRSSRARSSWIGSLPTSVREHAEATRRRRTSVVSGPVSTCAVARLDSHADVRRAVVLELAD